MPIDELSPTTTTSTPGISPEQAAELQAIRAVVTLLKNHSAKDNRGKTSFTERGNELMAELHKGLGEDLSRVTANKLSTLNRKTNKKTENSPDPSEVAASRKAIEDYSKKFSQLEFDSIEIEPESYYAAQRFKNFLTGNHHKEITSPDITSPDFIDQFMKSDVGCSTKFQIKDKNGLLIKVSATSYNRSTKFSEAGVHIFNPTDLSQDEYFNAKHKTATKDLEKAFLEMLKDKIVDFITNPENRDKVSFI